MPPGKTVLRMGSSLGGSSSGSSNPPASSFSSSRAAAPAESSSAPATGAPFDRVRAFRERLDATRAKATEQAVTPGVLEPLQEWSRPPPPPPPPVAQPLPVQTANAPPAPIPTVFHSPTLVYPIGGPRAPSSSSAAQSPVPAPATSIQSPPYQPTSDSYYAPACAHPYPNLPAAATPFVLPANPPHPLSAPPELSTPEAYPQPHWPAQPVYDAACGWSVAAHAQAMGGGAWPAPEPRWMQPALPAPPIPHKLTSVGAYGVGCANGAGGTSSGVMLGERQREPGQNEDAEAQVGHEVAQAPHPVAEDAASAPKRPHSPISPRTHRLDMSSTVSGAMIGFVSAFEREFGGQEGARMEALRVCGVGVGEGTADELERTLGAKLAEVWRDKILPLSGGNLDDAARDTLDGLHYLLLTSPGLASLPSPDHGLSELELALLDLGIRANGLDLVGEREAVRERWRAVEVKWCFDLSARKKTEEHYRLITSKVEAMQQAVETADDRIAALSTKCDAVEVDVEARCTEVAELRKRAERAEAKLKEKPSQRVVLLLQDLHKLTVSRDALSAELGTTRASLEHASADLARMRPPDWNASQGSPSAAAGERRAGGQARAQREVETELRRAKETHDADRLIWEEKVRVARAEADELRRKLAARTAASGEGRGDGMADEWAETMARELKKAREEATKKGFVVNRLAEKVKELNKELAEKAAENAELFARLIDSCKPAASRPPSTLV
ncbi:hypothetical protein JCM3770_005974 [Rhodotorula araucariae]